jgi:pSer/pThr/pTyr-binding forkhead associated (FHA) protein
MRISRQHLLFKQSPDGFRVVDLESTNGTELNGEELEPNREYDVSDGDQLELGGSAGITVHIR